MTRVEPEGLETAEALAATAPAAQRLPTVVRQLIFAALFSSFSIGYLVIYLTAFLPTIGFVSSTVGLLVGLFGLVPGITGIPLGIVSDRKGRKLLLLLGSLGVPPGILVFVFTGNIALLVVGTILLGLSEASFLSTWNALLADATDSKSRNRAFALSFVAGSVSFGLGSAVPFGFPLLERLLSIGATGVYQGFLIFSALFSLGTPIVAAIGLRGYAEAIHRRNGLSDPKQGSNISQPSARTRWLRENSRMLKFCGINSLIGLGAGFIIPLIPTWFLLRFQVDGTYTGPLLALSGVTIGLSAFGSTRLARKYGPIPSIVLTTGTSTIFMFSLAFIPNAAVAAGLYVVRAALMNMASPLMDSYLMSIILPEQRGLASAINTVIWRLQNSASTIVGGVILQLGLYNIPFLIAGAFYASAIVMLYSAFHNVKPGLPPSGPAIA